MFTSSFIWPEVVNLHFMKAWSHIFLVPMILFFGIHVFVQLWFSLVMKKKITKDAEPKGILICCLMLQGVAVACAHLKIFDFAYVELSPMIWRLGFSLGVFSTIFRAWAQWSLWRDWAPVVCILTDQKLITTGPYALCRHPIYTAYMFNFISIVLGCGNLCLATSLGIFFCYLLYRTQIEEKVLLSHFKDQYSVYMRDHGMLFPTTPHHWLVLLGLKKTVQKKLKS